MTCVYQSLFQSRSNRYVAPAAPASVHYLCLSTILQRIEALHITGLASASIVWKKLPVDRFLGSLKPLGITMPAVILWPISEFIKQVVNSADDVYYGAGCLTIQKDNQEPTVAAGVAAFLQSRQQISRGLKVSRTGPNAIPAADCPTGSSAAQRHLPAGSMAKPVRRFASHPPILEPRAARPERLKEPSR